VPATLARRRRIAAFRAVDTSMEGPDPATSIRPGDLLFIDPDAELFDGAIALVGDSRGQQPRQRQPWKIKSKSKIKK
jgi:hypothetical protein